MIKISENFSIESDRYCFILHHFYDGKNKKGEVKRQSKQTYHRTLEQVSFYMLHQAAKEAETITGIVDIMNKLAAEITTTLENKLTKG
jgi:hypothetical protein